MKQLENFERSLNHNYPEEMKVLMRQSFLMGYKDRVSEEEKFFNNKVIHIAGNDWYRYNYGSERERDCNYGNIAGGWELTYYEATQIPYMRLPTKSDFLKLFKSGNAIGKYNLATDGRTWNARVAVGEIIFYESRKGNSCPYFTDLNASYYSQIWLAEEDCDKALSVIIGIEVGESKKELGECTRQLKDLLFVMVPKKDKLDAHFIFDRNHYDSDWFNLK